MQKILKEAFQQKVESDTLILSKAVKIIRNDIFNYQCGFKFSGSLPSRCQQDSLPANLKYLVSMLLNGPNITDQDPVECQSALTIAQMILFNCKKRPSGTTNNRHNLKFEPPWPLYLGMKIHTQTRSKKLVMVMNDLGLCVSYAGILEIETQFVSMQKRLALCVPPSCVMDSLLLVPLITWITIHPAQQQKMHFMAPP